MEFGQKGKRRKVKNKEKIKRKLRENKEDLNEIARLY